MNFTFVIPTYNRSQSIDQLLKELEPCKSQLEVIILDDSTYGVYPNLGYDYPDWVIVDRHTGKRGAINCLNLGISKATNDWIILTGDDVHIPNISEFLLELQSAILYSNNPLIGFHVIDKHPRHIPTLICNLAWFLLQKPLPETGNKPKFCRFTSAFAFDKSKTFKRFDSNFIGTGHYAESDFILSNNLKVFYDPDLKIYHDELNLTTNPNYSKDKTYNLKYFLNKHGYS